jgi:DNA polymerase III subunit gamma/tau
VWDIKYRPLKFSDVLGQDGAVRVLKSRLRQGTALDTSYIFSGGHGQGKTTLARILARAMLCQNLNKDDPDPCNECESCKDFLAETSPAYVELDAASKGTIDNVRSIVDDLAFMVLGGSKRIYLFDEVHRMSRDSQDVLLKPIEEKRMIGIFCTTEAEKIRGTIRSRCEEHPIRKVAREEILMRMKLILAAENVEHNDDAVLTVIDYCDGHVRDVINKLGMISQLGAVTVESVRERLSLGMVSTYYEILLALDQPGRAVELIEQACERVGPDEVANGMAEAAMNAYRMAHGLFASFVTVDRDLAKQLHGKFGDNVIRLANHFTKSRYNTRIGLVCDTLVALPHTSAPMPVMVQAPILVQNVAPGAPAAVSAPAQAAPAPLGPVPTPRAQGNQVRPDGIGPLGQDPLAKTEFDHYGVRVEFPRGRTTVTRPLNLHVQGSEEDLRIITPSEWRREFERLWPSTGDRV